MQTLLDMLRYKRPEGSQTQKDFCETFLEPVFGNPDQFGNYILTIGDSGLCFTAHHDTVHTTDGMQVVSVCDGFAMTSGESNCLGADCTTGVWLILGMIDAGIEGTYIVHAGEELGCIGSRGLVESVPTWLASIDAVISFDRRGTDSIVTHQCGHRTASDAFAESLSLALDMPELKPDDSGMYTDSESYAGLVPECTNVSVGYHGQHSKSEKQDLRFAEYLLESLVSADWDSLVIQRNPGEDSPDSYTTDSLESFVYENPDVVAEYLDSFGITIQDILQEQNNINLYLERMA